MVTYNDPHLASAIVWWLNYISAVGREYIIAESTLKIPATEYLETYFRGNIDLEYNHPYLSQKRFDLHFKDEDNATESAFEFKFVREDSTRQLSERKRIFNDLMRLHLFLEHDKKGVFLICGNHLHFKTSFQNLNLNPRFPIPTSKVAALIQTGSGFFGEWFSFDYASPERTIDLDNADNSYKVIYDAFMNDYKDSYKQATGTALVRPNSIKTKLKFISEEMTASNLPQTLSIGIWEVIK
jgi:hypothetical protein